MQLLQTLQIGDLTLKNRVVMAPMTRNRTPDKGIPSAINATYYAQRASAGLIVTEATNVSRQAVGSPFTPGIYNQAQVAAWQQVTEQVHQQGGLIFCQLWHTGRVSHPVFQNDNLPVAPSAIKAEGKNFTHQGWQEYVTPRALSIAEIEAIVLDYKNAAQLAKEAGFDGVELHGAFGYLPNQFLSDASNTRDDEYGGSIENRSRFMLEIVEALISVWGSQRVGIRLAPSNVFNGVLDSDSPAIYGYLIKALDQLDLAYLSIMNTTLKTHDNPNFIYDVTAFCRDIFRGILITNTGFTKDTANDVLANNSADLVAFGVPYIANPDLVERFTNDIPLATAEKISFYGGGAEGYIDYPKA
jgi:N-ethylmaleimide reductase